MSTYNGEIDDTEDDADIESDGIPAFLRMLSTTCFILFEELLSMQPTTNQRRIDVRLFLQQIDQTIISKWEYKLAGGF